MPDWLVHFAAAAEGKGSKSTVLQPIMFFFVLVGFLFYGLTTNGAPAWAQIATGAAGGLLLVLFVGSYIFYSLKDPNCLRSEKYNLRKMEIEQSAIGDTERGVVTGSLPGEGRAKLIGGTPPRSGGEQS